MMDACRACRRRTFRAAFRNIGVRLEARMNPNGIEETDPLYARCMALRADVGAALSAPGPLAAMLQRCAEALARDLEAPGAWIWTLHPESAVLELQAIAGTEANRGSAAER